MTEPTVETIDDAMKRASEAIRALKAQKPKNDAEVRFRSSELVRLQQVLIDASHRVADAHAARRLNGGAKHLAL